MTLEAELAVHNFKLATTILTTCELQYSNDTLMIPLSHNTYSDTINNDTTTRMLDPTESFISMTI